MYRSKLATTVAILATAAGFWALAGTAQAQISGSIGGDYVDAPKITPIDGDPFQRGRGKGLDPYMNWLVVAG